MRSHERCEADLLNVKTPGVGNSFFTGIAAAGKI
jgi:hypothetical protein